MASSLSQIKYHLQQQVRPIRIVGEPKHADRIIGGCKLIVINWSRQKRNGHIMINAMLQIIVQNVMKQLLVAKFHFPCSQVIT